MLKFTGMPESVRNAHLSYSRTVKSHGLGSPEAVSAKAEVNRQKTLHILESLLDEGICYLTDDERNHYADRVRDAR